MLLCMLAGTVLSAVLPDLAIISVLLVLAGFVLLIIRAFGYIATVSLVVTRSDMTARKALKASREMMKGRKWRYFFLGLTFFGVFGMYPGIILSSIDPAYSITVFNGASSPLTLKIMLGVTLCAVPVVILYQAWVFWTFREKVEIDEKSVY